MTAAGELAEFFVHTVSAEHYRGRSGAGVDLYDPAVDLACMVEQKRRFVRSATGEQVVSESTVYGPTSIADTLTPKSRVTYRGQVSTVITVSVFDSAGLDLPDHAAVYLT